MNQGKIIVGIAVLLGICAGLAGYWWNYRVGHRAMEFWGKENARLIRLAPKVEYFTGQLKPAEQTFAPGGFSIKTIDGRDYLFTGFIDISQARGLIHLRNAILSDDQYDWNKSPAKVEKPFQALRFTDDAGNSTTIIFDTTSRLALRPPDNDLETTYTLVTLGPLAKSLEQFLAREVPRLKAEAAAEPAPAKSE